VFPKTQNDFDAEVIDKKVFTPGEPIKFRSKFDGKLTNGFFANLIYSPREELQKGVGDLGYKITPFPDTWDNLIKDRTAVRSTDPKSLDVWGDPGKLDGRVIPEWHAWNWYIPTDAPPGEYAIKMGVWNRFPRDNEPHTFKTVETAVQIRRPGATSSGSPFFMQEMGGIGGGIGSSQGGTGGFGGFGSSQGGTGDSAGYQDE
jgi:hypothetical protein